MGRIERVADQVDQQLLELIGIGADHESGPGTTCSSGDGCNAATRSTIGPMGTSCTFGGGNFASVA